MSNEYEIIFSRYPILITMSKSKASRFNAHERLSNKYKCHSLALAILSIYTIALTIFNKFIPSNNQQLVNYLAFISSVFSVFIVALSVYLAFSEDAIRGKYLHDNAKKISNLYHRLKTLAVSQISNPRKIIKIMEFEQEYKEIMDSCPYNHNTIDYEISLIRIRTEKEIIKLSKKEKFKDILVEICNLCSQYFWIIASITIPLILITICIVIYGQP